MSTRDKKLKSNVSRRDLLRYGVVGGALATLGPWGAGLMRQATGAVATQNHMTILNLFGGNDGLGTVIPTGGAEYAAYAALRPTIALSNNFADVFDAGDPTRPLRVGPSYALHPSLRTLKTLFDQGDVAIVNLAGYPNPNLSHFESEDIWSQGVRGSFGGLGVLPSGWIARWAAQNAPDPRSAVAIGVGTRRDFIGTSADPVITSRLSSFRFSSAGVDSDVQNWRLGVVRQALTGSAAAEPGASVRGAMDQAHQLVAEVQGAISGYGNVVSYPTSSPARQLQDVARLIEAGFPTQIFYTGFGGFDTHGDQGAGEVTGAHSRLLARLDGAIAAFHADMLRMGVWDNTVIVVMSEFGRRNYENGSRGTDHGHGNPLFVIGGGVNGGVYGPDLSVSLIQDEEWMPGLVDFRDVYREILSDHLGVSNLSSVFPESQPQSPQTLGLM